MRIGLIVVLFAALASATLQRPARADADGHEHAPQAFEPRLALVIGNETYSTARLQTPVADAELIASRLTNLGFEVVLETNLDDRGMRAAIARFEARMTNTPDAVGLVYFAGHGVQIGGINYLIPVNLRLSDVTTAEDVYANGVRLGEVQRIFEAANARIGFIVVDACRDNEFPPAYRSGGGLAHATGTQGMLIAFSAGPGQLASDGPGQEHSPYAAALDRALALPGVSPERLFRTVANQVYANTAGEQLPHFESALVSRPGYPEFTFAPGNASLHEHPSAEAVARDDALAWVDAAFHGTHEAYEGYLAAHPDGFMAREAQSRLDALELERDTTAEHQVTGLDRSSAIQPASEIPHEHPGAADHDGETLDHDHLAPVIGGVVEHARPLNRQPPTYPRAALQRGLEADCTAVFDLDEHGAVIEDRLRTDCTHPLFERVVIHAVANWRYEPMRINGEPSPADDLRVTIPFRLEG